MTSPAVGYNFYDEDLGIKLNDAPIPADSGTEVYSGLASNTVHTLTATAVNSAGMESARSAPITARTLSNPVAGQPMTADKQAAIDAIVAKYLPGGTPTKGESADGVIIGITTPDGDYYKAYGGDETPGLSLTLDDKMRFGSCTKMYTATLILAQVDAGHITLDDTLNMYVDGIANGDIITIKNLLQMQSGIEDYLQQDAAVSQQYFLNPTAAFDPLPHIKSYTPLFQPGTQTEYSNSNYILLGMILEWCDATYGTGRDIATIIAQDCLTPLGLSETEWPTGDYMTAPYSRAWSDNLALTQVQASLGSFYGILASLGLLSMALAAAGYGSVQTTPTIEFTAVNPDYAGAAGVLDGPIADFVNFGKAINSGALLSAEMKQQREEEFVTYLTYTPEHPWEGPGWMGMGLGVIQWGNLWLGWIGNLGGYVSTLFANPKNGSVIAILMNKMQALPLEMHYEIAYLLYPETTLIAPSVVRMGGAESPRAFGDMVVARWQAPGDEDGVTTVPHKVPTVL